mgnify:CR=1 FL=1
MSFQISDSAEFVVTPNGDKFIKNFGVEPRDRQTLDGKPDENFDFVFYIAGVDIHHNDRLGKLSITDEGINLRDNIVIDNFFSKRIPICGVLGGGYNKDFNKLIELHSSLHKTCAKYI